jgi:hypothetical protein
MADASAWFAKLEKMTPEQLAAAGLTAEDVAAAKKEHLLERDYTQKSQKVAALQQIQDANPDLNPKQVLDVYNWYRDNQGTVKDALELYNRRGELVERKAEPQPQPAGGKRKWREFEYVDPYDAERSRNMTSALREAFEDVHRDASEAAYKRWEDEYKSKEVPRLDKVADGMAAQVLGLMKFYGEDILAAARDPKHTPLDPFEVLKQGAARGESDFRKVADALRRERQEATKPIEEDAYKRGLEEGKKFAEGPSGPLGGPRPGWRQDPTEPAPKTREALLQKVVSAVEQRSGRPVPL